jgi:hypothetical protein
MPKPEEMITKQQFEEKSDGEEYLHMAAWAVVLRQFEHAAAVPCGSLYDRLVAMVFAFHSLEGFLNFVGDKIAPQVWANEREVFKDSGFAGKLADIYERCDISVPEKGRRPYSTIIELEELRNAMAHPKTVKTQDTMKFVEGKQPPYFAKSYLEKVVTIENALRAHHDVKQIADEIHKAAHAKFPHVDLGSHALEGIHGTRTSSTRALDKLQFPRTKPRKD